MPTNDILLNKYRLDRKLGEGAAGEVYLAKHLGLDLPRALKILRRDTPGLGSTLYGELLLRFRLEARVGALIEHPNVVRVYDFERDGEDLILVMEYCPGGSLAEYLERARKEQQPIEVEECLRWGVEMAQGLAELHKLDAVHRDLKPTNVLFDAQGRAKIADMGLAQVPGGPSRRQELSEPQPHPGTPGYMSPEQKNESNYLTSASDVYALGLLLFEALTLRSYSNQKPGTRAKSLRADVPEWLDELLVRMLAKDPEVRPWDGAEAAEALREGERLAEQKRLERERLERERLERERREKEERERREKAEREAEEKAAREAKAKAEGEAREKAAREAQAKVDREKAERERLERERRAAEERQRNALVLELAPGVSLELVRVPAGEFLMGSDKAKDKDALSWEMPQHKVFLDEYLIGKYPVTVRQFAAFVLATGYQTTAEKSGSGYNWTGSELKDVPGLNWKHPRLLVNDVKQKQDHPVVLVSWDDAVAFCQWTSKKIGKKVHLPNEAQWEKAARGTDGRIYPWGNQAPDEKRCNFNKYLMDTTSVGQYSPLGDSPYGCVDMAGNVWEWTTSLPWAYPYSEKDGRENPKNRGRRVLRGGAFGNLFGLVRCGYRHYRDLNIASDGLGFRVCVFPI